MIKDLNKIIKDKKAQVSVEFLIILGIVILAALAVGFYMKQLSSKNVNRTQEIKEKSVSGYN